MGSSGSRRWQFICWPALQPIEHNYFLQCLKVEASYRFDIDQSVIFVHHIFAHTMIVFNVHMVHTHMYVVCRHSAIESANTWMGQWIAKSVQVGRCKEERIENREGSGLQGGG